METIILNELGLILIGISYTLLIGYIGWRLSKTYHSSSDLNYVKKLHTKLIRVFQEIAYDYRIRIIKAGNGNLVVNGTVIENDADQSNEDCISVERMNQNPDYTMILNAGDNNLIEMDFSDSGNMYFIYFRLLGKHYMSYGITEITAWVNAIHRARIENKRLFSRSSMYDRNKI